MGLLPEEVPERGSPPGGRHEGGPGALQHLLQRPTLLLEEGLLTARDDLPHQPQRHHPGLPRHHLLQVALAHCQHAAHLHLDPIPLHIQTQPQQGGRGGAPTSGRGWEGQVAGQERMRALATLSLLERHLLLEMVSVATAQRYSTGALPRRAQ